MGVVQKMKVFKAFCLKFLLLAGFSSTELDARLSKSGEIAIGMSASVVISLILTWIAKIVYLRNFQAKLDVVSAAELYKQAEKLGVKDLEEFKKQTFKEQKAQISSLNEAKIAQAKQGVKQQLDKFGISVNNAELEHLTRNTLYLKREILNKAIEPMFNGYGLTLSEGSRNQILNTKVEDIIGRAKAILTDVIANHMNVDHSYLNTASDIVLKDGLLKLNVSFTPKRFQEVGRKVDKELLDELINLSKPFKAQGFTGGDLPDISSRLEKDYGLGYSNSINFINDSYITISFPNKEKAFEFRLKFSKQDAEVVYNNYIFYVKLKKAAIYKEPWSGTSTFGSGLGSEVGEVESLSQLAAQKGFSSDYKPVVANTLASLGVGTGGESSYFPYKVSGTDISGWMQATPDGLAIVQESDLPEDLDRSSLETLSILSSENASDGITINDINNSMMQESPRIGFAE